MGRGTEGNISSVDDVHDRLVHCIYAVVDNEDEWPKLFRTLDEFFDPGREASESDAHNDRISLLLPHVKRANLLLEKISELHLKSKHTDRVLDRIPIGIVLITPQAKILSINARAIALLEHIKARHAEGEIQFLCTKQQQSFLRVVKAIATGKLHGAPHRIDDLNLWITHYGDGHHLAIYLGHQTFQHNVRVEQLMDLFKLSERPPAKAGGFGLRLKAGLVRHPADWKT